MVSYLGEITGTLFVGQTYRRGYDTSRFAVEDDWPRDIKVEIEPDDGGMTYTVDIVDKKRADVYLSANAPGLYEIRTLITMKSDRTYRRCLTGRVMEMPPIPPIVIQLGIDETEVYELDYSKRMQPGETLDVVEETEEDADKLFVGQIVQADQLSVFLAVGVADQAEQGSKYELSLITHTTMGRTFVDSLQVIVSGC